MPGAQQQGGGQDPDNGMGALWTIVGLFVLFLGLWYFYRTQIVAFILTLRLYESDFISLFIPSGWAEHLSAARHFISFSQQHGYENVKFDDLINLSMVVGSYFRYPVFILLSALAAILYVSNPLARFKKTHSMKSLLKAEHDEWPFIAPVAQLDLLNTPLDKGPWAMAIQPMAFAKKNKLIVFEKPVGGAHRFDTKVPQTADINRVAARRVFALQMGRYWTTPEALPMHSRALFAVFSARVNGDRDGAAKLLEQIASSTASGKINYSGTEALLRKHKDNKHIIRMTQKYAFEITVMASLLAFARQDGVLASADFLWLKPVDRRLWFMLNCIGRQTPFPEVAGPFAHWLAEKEFGKRLNVPMVDEAVNGLQVGVKEFIYHPDDDDEDED